MIAVAPMQGYTDAPFRHFHAEVYGKADRYYSPFLRMEHGELRRRDLRDVTSPLNGNHHVTPQVIFRDMEEFNTLVDAVAGAGYREVDLNLGCPFPPQVRKGRGAGVLLNRKLLEDVGREIERRGDIAFSVKMRLGVTAPDEWHDAVEVFNSVALDHVTVHPRVATQQYDGELYMDAFSAVASALRHPVVFNGDIASLQDIGRGLEMASGVMVGRGLLARPSLLAEWKDGREWTRDERINAIIRLHGGVFGHYAATLCGDAQILMKIKPFWEYLEPEIGHKSAKLIKKATSVAKYESAVESIE